MRTVPLTMDRCTAVATHWPAERATLLGRLQWHVRTPYAHALLVLHGDEPLAVGCCLAHPTSGRITLLLTVEGPLAENAHTTLAHALLQHLEAQGCASVAVVAPTAHVPRWTALGFAEVGPLLRYADGRFVEASRDEVVPLEPHHRLGMLHLDRQASGEDRSTLLMEHHYLGTVYLEGSRVRGFALPLLGEGLIVADAPAVGLELQRWLFPLQDHVLLPTGNHAHTHLVKQGYGIAEVGVRLVRGAALDERPGMYYATCWRVL